MLAEEEEVVVVVEVSSEDVVRGMERLEGWDCGTNQAESRNDNEQKNKISNGFPLLDTFSRSAFFQRPCLPGSIAAVDAS